MSKTISKKNKGDAAKIEPETLYDVDVGQTVWVTSIEIDDANMRRRLQDLGIIEGTRVLCRQRAPSGNPKSYLVRGATIAIRQGDSSRIKVTMHEPSTNDIESVISRSDARDAKSLPSDANDAEFSPTDKEGAVALSADAGDVETATKEESEVRFLQRFDESNV